MNRITENAIIDGTMLGREDHGIMTCFVYLKFNGSHQGFGGYGMDEWDEATKERQGGAFGMEFIIQVLKTIGVDNWEQLKGKHCRADHDWGKVYRIGHIIEDKWFEPEALAKQMKLVK